MSKSNDPSGTAIKTIEHPHFAWFIRKASVWFTILQYRLAAKQHVRFAHLDNYRLFRYEDLLASPERILRELCEFIGIDFREEMLEPQKGQHEHQPSTITGKQQKAFDRAAAVRWRSVISSFDNWLIFKFTRKAMARLDYDPEMHPILRKVEEDQQLVAA